MNEEQPEEVSCLTWAANTREALQEPACTQPCPPRAVFVQSKSANCKDRTTSSHLEQTQRMLVKHCSDFAATGTLAAGGEQ